MKYGIWTRIAALLLALVLLVSSVYAAPVGAAYEAETEYIIKYKEHAAWRRKDSRVPFDVVNEAEMRRLRDAGLLEWYEPDGLMELLDEPSFWYDEAEKWDLAMIHADAAFVQNALGQGVRVGVVDSGINHHPALNSSLLSGSNYVDGADASDTADRYGHGTLVAGLIAGADENGCLGAAPDAELVPLKVTDGKTVTVSTVCRAIYGGIDDFDCDILNLSLGIRSDYQSLREAVEYAEERGVVIVAAVGNNGSAALYYPACYETVIGVGAVDETGAVYYHSNQNDSVFLTAPGANVKTTGKFGGYTTASGTSFAVPHVTAAASVLWSIDQDLTPQDIRTLLSRTATDRDVEGWDKAYGWGIVNVEGSILALTEEMPPPDDPPPDDPPPDNPPPRPPSYEECPKDDTCPMSAFTDVDMNAWYHDGVHWALDEGIMVGTGDTTFSPNTATTRAMLVTMLWRMEGESVGAGVLDGSDTSLLEGGGTRSVTEGVCPFTDVVPGSWYEQAVLWAAETGITAGTSATTFSPNDELTREQLATFLRRYAAYKGLDVSASADLSGYTDAGSISDFALESVRWAVAVGILKGTSGTTLSPKKSATRAEVASMLMRYHTNN